MAMRRNVRRRRRLRLGGARRQSATSERFAFEPLEDRRMLAGYFDTIANQVSGPSGAMATVTGSLRAIDSLTRLPIINTPIDQIGDVTEALESFRLGLDNTLRSLSPGQSVAQIQAAIYNALGPSGVSMLANRTGPATVGPEDVGVTPGGGGVDIVINIGLTSDDESSPVGLGVDSIPFRPAANEGDGSFSVGLVYQNFNFGYNTSEGAYFRTAAPNELQFTINGHMPAAFTAGLGFLNFAVEDGTPGVPDLTLSFTADVTPSFTIANPQISGGVHLLLGMEASFPAPGLPEFRTDMRLDWTLPNVSPTTGLGAAWGVPTLRFENVEMNVGSMLGSIVQPIAERVQTVFEPLQPVFDLITTRIPGLSDLSEALGGPKVDLVFMSKVMSALPEPPSALITIIESANRLRQFSETVDVLAGLGNDHWIRVGDFTISGPSGGSLLGAPAAALGNLGLNNWSDLVYSGNGINFDGLKAAIRDELGDEVGGEINSLWDALSGEFQGNGLTVDVPLAKDPAGVALGMLLGRDADLVTVTGRLNLDVDKTFNLSPIPGLIVGLQAAASFDAYAKLGYDTHGLREAIAPLYVGGNFDVGKMLNGLWIDRNTGLTGEGFIRVAAGVGIPDVVELTAGGQLSANLHVGLSNPLNHDKIRPLAGELGDSLFFVSGTMDAAANVRFKAGIELFGEWIGIDKTWNFASVRIFEFNTDRIAVPPGLVPQPTPPVVLAEFHPGLPTTLLLNVGDRAALRGIGVGEVNENYRIKHLSRFGFALQGANGIIEGIRYIDTIEISAFGVTQEFSGEITNVQGLFGGGNDTLKISDDSSEVTYVIYGGTGNDKIDVDGRANVTIHGEEGDDVIDGGNGASFAIIYGGAGFDKISFGDGRLENVNPNAFIEVGVSGIDVNDGVRDELKVDNSRSTSDTTYDLDYTDSIYDLVLTAVVDEGAGPVSRTIFIDNARIDLYSGRGDDRFRGMPPNGSRIYAGAGDDELDVNYYSPGRLPSLPREFLDYTVTFYGGEGQDALLADNSASELDGIVQLGNGGTSSGGPEDRFAWGLFNSLYVSGIDETTVKVAQNAALRVYAWANGDVHVEAGELLLYTDGYMARLGLSEVRMAVDPITGVTPPEIIPYTPADLRPYDTHFVVRNTPKVTVLDDRPDLSFSHWRLDANGPYIDFGLNQYLNLNLDAAATTFSFRGGRTVVDLSQALLDRPWTISFDPFNGARSAQLDVASIGYFDAGGTAPNYTFRLDGDAFRVGTKTWPVSGVAALNVYSGQGNDVFEPVEAPVGLQPRFFGGFGDDNFILGDGVLAFMPAWVLNGGDGNDAVTFDNRLNTGNHTVEITPNLLWFFSGVFGVSTDGFETVNWWGGSGNDQIRFSGNTVQSINVKAGAGDDVITVGWNGVTTSFRAPLRIEGEDGSDNIVWNGVNNGFADFGIPSTTYPVTILGGPGYNALAIHDQTRGNFGAFTDYRLYADRFSVTEAGIDSWADFTYDDMSAVSLNLSDNSDTVHVYGTSSDLAPDNQFSIYGNGGADDFWIHPRDAAGNLTINGNLGIGGGGNTSDRVVIDDSLSTLPITYGFENYFGPATTNVTGLGAGGFGAGSDVERIEVRGGAGDDEFTIHSFAAPSGLSLFGHGGVDRAFVSRSARNLTPDVMGMAGFLFDGGDSFDHFELYNDESDNTWLYTRTAEYLSTQNNETGQTATWNQQNVEYLDVTGGKSIDVFLIKSTPNSAQSFNTFRGAGGGDSYYLGDGGRTDKIVSNVAIVNDDGVDSATVDNSADAAGRTVHVNDYFVGAVPGDNIFGPGGYLYHVNLAGELALFLGDGADTTYVAPDPLTTVFVRGDDPVAAPGDAIGLALANVVNPVVTPLSLGRAQYSFDNAAPIVYQTFEQVTIDAVQPVVVSQHYTETAPAAVVVQFSENVFNTPNPVQIYYLELINNATGQRLPFTDAVMSYDQATNVARFTFPNHVGGRPPAGTYTARILAEPTDFYGNRMDNQPAFTFTATAPIPGDFNGDNTVAAGDLPVWGSAFGKTAAADTTGDGVTDGADFLTWQRRLGQQSSAATLSAASASASSAKLDTPVSLAELPILPRGPFLVPQPDARLAQQAFRPASRVIDAAFAATTAQSPAAWTTRHAPSLRSQTAVESLSMRHEVVGRASLEEWDLAFESLQLVGAN